MRLHRLFPLVAVALLLGACQGDPMPEEEADAMYDTYGEAFTPEGAVAAEAVAAEPASYVGQAVLVEGTVREVCQQAGCWLTLETTDGPAIRVRVPRDEAGEYVYTVPTDISGRRVVVHGTLAEGELSAEMAQHYAEESGGHAEGHEAMHEEGEGMTAQADTAAAAPTKELTLTADGVMIQKV